MKYPCEIVSRHYLPAFRSLIAKGLIKDHSFTQVAAAEKIGTTQAAISQYLSSKRGKKYTDKMENNPLTKSTIGELVNGIVGGTISSEELMRRLCALCMHLRENDLLEKE